MSRPGEAARAAALALVEAVLVRGEPLDEAIEKALRSGGRLATLEIRDRAFARLLVTTVLRRVGQIDAALAACLDRPLSGRALRAREILRLAAKPPREVGGRAGPEPTRYGDWEVNGICVDF